MITEPRLINNGYESFGYTPFESKVFTQHNRDCSLAQIYGGRIHFVCSYNSHRPETTNSLYMTKYWAFDLTKEQTAWQMHSYSSYPQYLRMRMFGGDFPIRESFSKREEQEYYENIRITEEQL